MIWVFFSNRCQTELREEPKNSHRPSERPTTRELLEILCGYEENELESVELFDLDEKMEFTAGKLQFEDVIKVL